MDGLITRVNSARLLGQNQLLEYTQAEGSLNVTMPELVTPCVLAVDIEGEPDITPGILQQGDGSLTLPAAAAVVKQNSSSLISLTPTGITENWKHASDYLQWECSVMHPGLFAVEITTTSDGHSAPWHGGHSVQVTAGGSTAVCVLEMDRKVEDASARYYAQTVSLCGRLEITEAGVARVELRATDIVGQSGLHLLSLKLVSV